MSLVVSGLSYAAPEWSRGKFSSKFGPHIGHSRLYYLFACVWGLFCPAGLLFQLSGVFAALPAYNFFSGRWSVFPQVLVCKHTVLNFLSIVFFLGLAFFVPLSFLPALPLLFFKIYLVALVSIVSRFFVVMPCQFGFITVCFFSCFASQCSSEVHQELPKRLAIIFCRVVLQCAQTSHSLSGPRFSISSGFEAFWPTWNVKWSLWQRPWTHHLPISAVRPKNQLTSGSLGWRLVVGVYVLS